MEKTGDRLSRTLKVFFNLAQSLDDENMEKIKAEIAPQLAKHSDDIHLNPKLFARIDTLYKQRTKLGLDPVSLRLLERYHLDFVRAGAQLKEADQKTLRANSFGFRWMSSECFASWARSPPSSVQAQSFPATGGTCPIGGR